jgi:DNA-binding NtrC family response regulator
MYAGEVSEPGRMLRRESLGRVLVIDDESIMLQALRRILEPAGYEVETSDDPAKALDLARTQRFEVALVDVRMPHMSGIEVLERLKADQPDVEVVMMTAYGTPEMAFAAVKLGAYDWLKKPFEDIDEVPHVVSRALEHRRLVTRAQLLEHKIALTERYEDLIGRSPAMRELFEVIDSAAPSDSSILIQGESGTGKELVARAIHRRSPRANKPLVAVHCGAIAEALLESELFGHVRGAFTGASQNRKGHFEVAAGGTIFLDEIGDMSLALQVKLLRVLQEGEIMRVGSSEIRQVDVRTIAASNVDLQQAKKEGRFREDLFYRLNVITVRLPSLRERQEDIPLLAGHFLRKYAERTGKPVGSIAPEAMDALLAYAWPGNVRELENVIEAAVVMARSDTIQLRDFRADLRGFATTAAPLVHQDDPYKDLVLRPFAEAKSLAVESFERAYVKSMLERTGGNISEAARRAGLDRSNFRRVMSRHKVEDKG